MRCWKTSSRWHAFVLDVVAVVVEQGGGLRRRLGESHRSAGVGNIDPRVASVQRKIYIYKHYAGA